MEHAAAVSYAEKAKLFTGAAKLLRADGSQALLLLHALQPLIDLSDSEFFLLFVKPNWNAVRASEDASHHIHAIRDFAGDPRSRQLVLELLRLSLPILKNRLAASPAWDDCLARLVDALSAQQGAAPQVRQLGQTFAPLRRELTMLGETSRERALAAMVLALFEVLS